MSISAHKGLFQASRLTANDNSRTIKMPIGGKMQSQSTGKTVATLLELAITAEKVAEDLYLGLAQKFSHLPKVSDFWQEMRKDEVAHARGLEKVRASLTPEQLLTPVDSVVLEQARRSASFSARDALNSITTVEEAYQLTHDLENSEINTVFEFIVAEFVAQEVQKELVMSQLREHVARLNHFPEAFRILGSASG
jgi:rubrerythrin